MIVTKTLIKISKKARQKELVLGDIVREVAGKGHLLIILILALPFLIPIPLPGLSVPFGVLIAITAFLLLLGRPLWIPESLEQRTLPKSFLTTGFRKMAGLFRSIENRIRPRFVYFTKEPMSIVSIICIICCGILLALPLPPGTNFLPALSIVLLSLGKLRSDGLCIMLGTFTFLLNCAFFLSLFIMGHKLLEHFA